MKKSTLALVFAVILAVLAVVAARNYLTKEKQEIEKGTRLVPILIAADTISPDETVRLSHVENFEIPEKCLLKEMILPTHSGRIMGKRPSREIRRGDLLLESYFTEREQLSKVVITDGMRIATVGVNSVSGVAGLVAPGDYVDVIWTYRGNAGAAGGGSESALTLFSQVLVYAVDDVTTVGYRAERQGRSRGPVTPYNTVTLLLFPLECELLTFAKSQGEVTLVKRSPTDGSSPPSPGVDGSHLDELLGQARNTRLSGGRK